MSELLPIFITVMLLAVASHLFSRPRRPGIGYQKKEALFYLILTVILILFVGLRVSYNDTMAYTHAYGLISGEQGIFENIDWKLGNNFGFNIVSRLLAKLGSSVQTFLMFYAAVTVGIYLWFIRKYTCSIWLSVFLFFTVGSYTFTMAAVKQCAAVALSLLAVDCALRKKWLPFVFWILLASTIHPYALMYLVVPLMMFRPWSGKTYLLIALFIVGGFLLQPLMGTVISITTLLGKEYDAASFSGEGINPFRLAVCLVPILLSFAARRVVWARNDRTQNLMLNLTMLNGAIMFVALFGTANYFGRLANYFLIFSVISIPWLLTMFERRSERLVTTVAVVCYFAYFYYANAINQCFDNLYSNVPLGEYLRSLLK